MHALSLQSLLNWEVLPALPALELLLLGGCLVECLKVLGKDVLGGEAALTLGTGIVLSTAEAVCTFTRAQIYHTKITSRELLRFSLIGKSN